MYAAASFDQLLYLQQLICFVDGEQARLAALREAFRILRPSGLAVFSFLSYEVRSGSMVYSLFLAYLRLFRLLSRSKTSEQTLPWLRLRDRFNFASLLDRGPYVYWFRADEAADLLQTVGFTLRAIGTRRQVLEGRMHSSAETLANVPMDGALYCVCSKPSSTSEPRA